MRNHHYSKVVLILVFVLSLATLVMAEPISESQNQAEAPSDGVLSDEMYRQEVQNSVITPCLEEVFGEMLKVTGIEDVTVSDFKQVFGGEAVVLKKAEGLTDVVIARVKGKPENERRVWYKIGLGMCIKEGKERMRKDNPLDFSTSRQQENPAPHKAASALPDRSIMWDQMKKADAFLNEQIQGIEALEQERLRAVERRQTAVPEAIRQETLQRCKKKFARIEKAGFGGGSWSLLQSCVSNELDAYLDLKQTYGDALSD